MKLYEVNPVDDARWIDLVERHCRSTIFHTAEWLTALNRTYDYEPVVITDSAPGEPLKNGLLFCRVSSWLTGRRLVSLPYSDHCDPLVVSMGDLTSMLECLKSRAAREGSYIELRPLSYACSAEGFHTSATFCCHAIDLRSGLEEVFARFHKSHTQRSIRKAERFGLTLETRNARGNLKEFYLLHSLTRRRQGTPIQPYQWFTHLVESFGDRLRIHLARFEGAPAAAILTIVHKKTLVYKYGCSNASLNRYGGTPLLFWKAIQQAKEQGLEQFDLGRSDIDNKGLIAFKEHLGAQRTPLHYYRYSRQSFASGSVSRRSTLAKHLYSLLPERIQMRGGRGLYKHFG